MLFLRKKYEFQNFDLVTFWLHISAVELYPARATLWLPPNPLFNRNEKVQKKKNLKKPSLD